MLASAIVASARLDIHDDVEPYRWPDPVMLGWINDGRRLIAKERIDAFCKTSVVVVYPGDLASLAAETGLRETVETALTWYVCARALATDAEHAANTAAAAAYMQQFIAGVA